MRQKKSFMKKEASSWRMRPVLEEVIMSNGHIY